MKEGVISYHHDEAAGLLSRVQRGSGASTNHVVSFHPFFSPIYKKKDAGSRLSALLKVHDLGHNAPGCLVNSVACSVCVCVCHCVVIISSSQSLSF